MCLTFNLVIRLLVNRLPVKLPITGCIFKLAIIESIYRYFSLHNEISGWSFISIVFTHSHRETKTWASLLTARSL